MISWTGSSLVKVSVLPSISTKDDWAKMTRSEDYAITLIFAMSVLPTPTHACVDLFKVLKVLG
jgi:hypothetical protein